LKTHLSELKLAEKTLEEQRELLQTILGAIPDFVSLQDRQAVYRSANKAFCEVIGKSEQEIIGKTQFDLFSRPQADIFHQEDMNIFETGNFLIKENKIYSPKGKRWLHVVKIPVFDADGIIVGLLCSGRDITELKRVQEQLTQAQKMESIGQLTAGIAHEINTPLGIVLGYAQLLLEDVSSDSQLHADLKLIEKHTQLCRKIVSDLLKFSRRTESNIVSLDVNKSIEETVLVVEHTFKLNRVTINRNYASGLPAIKGDKEKLKQVFVNLLGNAHDAIGTDGTITINTSLDDETSEVVILLADTGCGISPNIIKRIFDPFYTTKQVDRGTGLGLSVTFGIINEHGGSIEVESPPSIEIDDGPENFYNTVFIIRLPVSKNKEILDGESISTG
jgi:PAS domain S-box-containing protein